MSKQLCYIYKSFICFINFSSETKNQQLLIFSLPHRCQVSIGKKYKASSVTMNSKFEKMSSLVLVDILAALPMEQVVRMARLGHETLRHTCSLKWVKDRMSDVTFPAMLTAYQAKGDVAKAFCIEPLMKRINGKVARQRLNFKDEKEVHEHVELIERMPGRLAICLDLYGFYTNEEAERLGNFLMKLKQNHRIAYTSLTLNNNELAVGMIKNCPEMVLEHDYYPGKNLNIVCYRPALLNGRHVFDVLRAVYGPADVSEAELDRVRREATEEAYEIQLLPLMDDGLEGLWCTYWRGSPLTVQGTAVF